MQRWMIILILILVLVLLLGFGSLVTWRWQETRRERSQDDVIRAAAARYEVEPALVKAVVWRESRFHPGAVGRAGELGLMQLQAIAAQEWADAERVSGFRHAHCLDPGTNVLAGTFYLAKLLRRYRHTDDPIPYALADYNAGRTHVLRWVQGEGETNSARFIEAIGFPATQQYVVQVMDRARRYQH